MKTFALLLSLSFWPMLMPAADIVALCIGNNHYVKEEDRLDTPVNDAIMMKGTLERLPGEADVKLLVNASKEEMELALNALKTRAQGAKLALVFYSGHGMDGQPEGYATPDTFLLPVEATIPDENYLHSRAISVKTVLESLKASPVTARAVILDCCRTGAPKATAALTGASKSFGNLDERVKQALGKAVVPDATLIAFAASPGRKAAAFLTDNDTNSPFTKFLTDEFRAGRGNLRDLVERAAEATEEATGKRQVPYVTYTGSASAIRQIVFHESSSASPSQPETKKAPVSETLSGSYTYGDTFGAPYRGRKVAFQITTQQVPDSRAFTGVMAEEYTDFGTPHEGKLWADIHGTMEVVEGVRYMTFTKTYRHFDQPSVIYRGIYNAQKGGVQGTWAFPEGVNPGSGTFIIKLE